MSSFFSLWLQGAQEIIQELPHEYVSPDDLKEVCENGGEQEELVSSYT